MQISCGLHRFTTCQKFAKLVLQHINISQRTAFGCTRNNLGTAIHRQKVQSIRIYSSARSLNLYNFIEFSRPRCLSTSSSNQNDSQWTHQWDAMFQQLKEYKSVHGDTLVPASYPENPQLGHWVYNNRYAYRMRMELESEKTCANGIVTNPSSTMETFGKMMSDEKIEGACYILIISLLASHDLCYILTLY
jgi:hypothetical protein